MAEDILNERTLNFENNLGFISSVFLPKYQRRFEKMATVLDSFQFYKVSKTIVFRFRSFIEKDDFERRADSIFDKEYRINEENGYDDLVKANQSIFDELETEGRNTFEKYYLGEGDHSKSKFRNFEFNTIQTYTTDARLFIGFTNDKGALIPFNGAGDEYYEIIAPKIELVTNLANLAKQYSIDNGNFFNLS